MKTRLLILALLTAPVAAHATKPQEALARGEQEAAHWLDWQVRAASMESALIDNVTKNSQETGEFLKAFADFDRLEAQVDRNVRTWHDSKIAAWNAQAAAGTISADEASRRAGFADRIFRLRMLLIYGNLAPRVIDAASVGRDGKPNGRLLAGPDWGIAISLDDYNVAQKELIRLSGLSPEDSDLP